VITESEKQEIINAAIEKLLLMLPEVIGNLITNHVALNRMNKQFYDKYPNFKDHKSVVASVVERVEGTNTLDDYEKILEKAVPEIKKAIAGTKDLNITSISKPNLNFDHGEL
jgi:hypothetical protein